MTTTVYDTALRAARQGAARLETLRGLAVDYGLDRDRADALLVQAQAGEVGSTPTADTFATAELLLWAEYEAAHPVPTGDPFTKLATPGA
ncbi:hypothetical protein ACGFZP_05215 [Kitasatospora sp. NPDC048239]|uniref:hypothetical protein n=1 Tax=Kitasatospora sp. NPDC048239 TaxID=3364046 RepID=UPI00371F87B9